jgi:Zn-dependent peptidase ImmA (M78 family)
LESSQKDREITMARITAAQKQAIVFLKEAKIRSAPVPVEKLARLLNAEIHLEPFAGELSGMVHKNADGSAVIGVNSLDAPTRRRFTIAHEIGHLLLHGDEHLHIDEKFPIRLQRDAKSSLGTDRIEVEANQFAAELLMPRELLAKDIAAMPENIDAEQAIELLARKYEVSPQAISLRLTVLGFIK